METNKRIPILNCGGKTGRAVVFGYVDKLPQPDEVVEIFDARMVFMWDRATSGLLGLAANGPKHDTRLSSKVARVRDHCRQMVEVSPEAAIKLDEWESWV